MKYSWILLIALFGLIATIVLAFLNRAKHKNKIDSKNGSYKILANTAMARNLPEYKSARHRYHLLVAITGLLFVTILSTVAVLASRPVSVTTSKPEYENRDIMLCLDVSGSMFSYVEELLDYFSKLIQKFQGQRVGLTIFDGGYMTISPLSDDYDALSELFLDLKDDPFSYWSAVYGISGSTSQIGPGLVGCVNSFDKLEDEERSRAIILSTDNYAGDNQAVNITQAANYAKRFNIAIYGLSTSDWRSQEEINNISENSYEPQTYKEYREAMLATGGAYYAFSKLGYSDNIVVQEIADQILSQAAARYEGAETIIQNDVPFIPALIALVGFIIFLIIIWRLGI